MVDGSRVSEVEVLEQKGSSHHLPQRKPQEWQ